MTRESLERLKKFDFFKNYPVPCDEVLKHVKLKWGAFQDIPDGITVILITYKRLGTLKEAVESILNQSETDGYQLLIIDNEGISTIPTEVEKYIYTLNDPRVIYFQQDEETILGEKLGYSLYDAGFTLARTEWTVLMHDDDLMSPDYIRIMRKIINGYPQIDAVTCMLQPFETTDQLCFNHYTVQGERITVKFYNETEFQEGFNKPMLGTLVRRKYYIKLGFYSAEIGIKDIENILDVMYMARLARYCRVCYIDNKLYGYRTAVSSASFSLIWDDALVCRCYFLIFLAKQRNWLLRPIFVENAKYFSALEIEHLSHEDQNAYRRNLVKDKDTVYQQCGLEKQKYVWKGIRVKIVRIVAKLSKCYHRSKMYCRRIVVSG